MDAEVPRQRQKKAFVLVASRNPLQERNPTGQTGEWELAPFARKSFGKGEARQVVSDRRERTNAFKGLRISEVKFRIHFGALAAACRQYSSFPRTFCFLLAYS